jgi:hypothetical protein
MYSFAFRGAASKFGRHPLVEAARRQRTQLQHALPFVSVDSKGWDTALANGSLADPDKRLQVKYIVLRLQLIPVTAYLRRHFKSLDSADKAYLVRVPGLDPAVISGPKGRRSYCILVFDVCFISCIYT